MKEIITTIKIDDNGNVIGTSTETKVIGEKKEEKEHLYSQYATVFDERCYMHTKNLEYNMCFLRNQEMYLNDKLKAKGHLFLNEAYDALCVPRTKIGQLFGWVYDGNNPKYNNHVEFKLYPCIGGNIIIDFNVDELILNLI